MFIFKAKYLCNVTGHKKIVTKLVDADLLTLNKTRKGKFYKKQTTAYSSSADKIYLNKS